MINTPVAFHLNLNRGLAPNGVMDYKPSKTGAVPQQISANSTNWGAMQMLQKQFILIKEISGGTDAI